MMMASRYVDIHSDNRIVFSYEFASMLRDCVVFLCQHWMLLLKGLDKRQQETLDLEIIVSSYV